MTFDDIDARLGWSEPGCELRRDSEQQRPIATVQAAAIDVVAHNNDREPDVDQIPIARQSDGIIKLLAMLLASDHLRLELLTLCAAFGMGALLGGRSFAAMAQECGISKQAFSKRVLRMQDAFGLNPWRGQKCKAARENYREKQKEIWQRLERHNLNFDRFDATAAHPASSFEPETKTATRRKPPSAVLGIDVGRLP